MSLSASRVTVTTTATLLVTASGHTRVTLRWQSGSANWVDLGPSGVTSGGGLYFSNDAGGLNRIQLELSDNQSLYAIADSNSAVIDVLTSN